ncbi:MAG: phosphatase PAP2 family protein [Spirochaetes bacterium]|nr:phosphatase PAP2 family protein [Spirochaetota bacterium]
MDELKENRLFLYDRLSMAVCLIYSLCAFANMGKLEIRVLSIRADYGIVYGTLFLALPLFIYFMIRRLGESNSKAALFVRIFYVQLLCGFFFKESIVLSQLFSGGASYDALFASADHFLFGMQPSITFHQSVPESPLLTEIFFMGYFFFYPLVTVGWWWLFFRGRIEEAVRSLQIVTVSFYIHYLFYIFFPVMGPKYYFMELYVKWYDRFDGYLITDFMKGVFNNMDLGGAAFPSSHVAISLVSLGLNFKYNRPLAWAFLPFTMMLYLSTVFLYAHYAVDVIGGLCTGFLCLVGVPRLVDREAVTRLFERGSGYLSSDRESES